MNIVISGGGTGGHIFPALAIADYFRDNLDDANIIYVGAKYGIENDIVPLYGYKMETLDIKGIRRKITPDNIKRGLKAVWSIKKCHSILKKNDIDLVIGTGGYAAGPICYVAEMMKIKTAIHEQNVIFGVTNKILAKKADFVFCGFKETIDKYPDINAIFTGNPVKKTETTSENIDIRKVHSIPAKNKIILIVGGSGGSEKVNQAVLELIMEMKVNNNKNITIIHSTGRDYYEEVKSKIGNILDDNYIAMPFIDHMGDYIKSADIAVGSSGASSIAEYNYYKKPIIAIPKSFTAGNHQEFNSRAIEKNGAGVCILEKDLTGKVLYKNIMEIISDDNKIKKMSENSAKLYNENTLKIIYTTIMEKM